MGGCSCSSPRKRNTKDFHGGSTRLTHSRTLPSTSCKHSSTLTDEAGACIPNSAKMTGYEARFRDTQLLGTLLAVLWHLGWRQSHLRVQRRAPPKDFHRNFRPCPRR